MDISIYQASVPSFVRALESLAGVLQKAAAYAAAERLDPSVMLGARLCPDMFDLGRHVQIVADGARGAAARLAGQTPHDAEDWAFAVFNRGSESSFEPNDTSFEAAIARLEAAIAYVSAVSPDRFLGASERRIELTMLGRTRVFKGVDFLLGFVLPNLYFHTSIAYALLRQAGVDLGKQDYEGPPVYQWLPAAAA